MRRTGFTAVCRQQSTQAAASVCHTHAPAGRARRGTAARPPHTSWQTAAGGGWVGMGGVGGWVAGWAGGWVSVGAPSPPPGRAPHLAGAAVRGLGHQHHHLALVGCHQRLKLLRSVHLWCEGEGAACGVAGEAVGGVSLPRVTCGGGAATPGLHQPRRGHSQPDGLAPLLARLGAGGVAAERAVVAHRHRRRASAQAQGRRQMTNAPWARGTCPPPRWGR